jgi:spore coat protein JB
MIGRNGRPATGAVCPRGRCETLLKQIRIVDFSLVETVLYLDLYPGCSQALAHYHQLRKQREELVREYETVCGPLTMCGNESSTTWDWVKGPWPWEAEAN